MVSTSGPQMARELTWLKNVILLMSSLTINVHYGVIKANLVQTCFFTLSNAFNLHLVSLVKANGVQMKRMRIDFHEFEIGKSRSSKK